MMSLKSKRELLGVVYLRTQIAARFIMRHCAKSRSGGIGRRARLKIVFPTGMRVRFPPSAHADYTLRVF